MSVLGRRSYVILVVVLSCVGVGAAVAYFLGFGSGSGSATAGTPQPVKLSPATAAAQLHPGGQADVRLTIANANAATVRVESLALDTTQGSGGFAVDTGHATCGLSTLAFATQTNAGAGWTVPGNGSLAVTLTGPLSMTTAAANACQGASFTVFLKSGA